MKCPKCGNENPDDAFFCGECGVQLGSKFSQSSGPVDEIAGDIEIEPLIDQPAAAEPQQPAPQQPAPAEPALSAGEEPQKYDGIELVRIRSEGPPSICTPKPAEPPAPDAPPPPRPPFDINAPSAGLAPPPGSMPPPPPHRPPPTAAETPPPPPPAYPGAQSNPYQPPPQAPYQPPATGYQPGGYGYYGNLDSNTSGMGPGYPVPPEASGWTFAGCVPYGLFAFINGSVLWGVLGIVLNFVSLGIVYIIYIGIQGRELAWRSRRFANVQQYVDTMNAWNVWGIVLAVVSGVAFGLWFLFVFGMAMSDLGSF
ncbi:zinc ribbon domain-containing protein [bacterium]|nr:zinc ribbon domain-containing protein [bacterium]